MDNTCKHSIKLTVDKAAGLVHLSVRSSEYKVEVFKLPISDIGSILTQFRTQMREQEDIITITPDAQDINNVEEGSIE